MYICAYRQIINNPTKSFLQLLLLICLSVFDALRFFVRVMEAWELESSKTIHELQVWRPQSSVDIDELEAWMLESSRINEEMDS